VELLAKLRVCGTGLVAREGRVEVEDVWRRFTVLRRGSGCGSWVYVLDVEVGGGRVGFQVGERAWYCLCGHIVFIGGWKVLRACMRGVMIVSDIRRSCKRSSR